MLEARRVLDAAGFDGNDCAPELDLSAIEPQTVVVGEEIVLDLPALGGTLIDLDSDGNPTGDALRWLADPDTGVDFPEGATLSTDGVFRWTPGAEDIGEQLVTILGIDSGFPALADAASLMITVDPGNPTAPDLAAIDDQQINVGVELVVAISAADPDPGETLSFTLDPGNAPAGATITKTGDTTAEIRWTPEAGDVGTVDFGVIVTDDGDPERSDSETFQVEVFEVNLSPNLADPGPQTAVVDTEMVVEVTATDDNTGQTLTFFLDPSNSPDGATITKTGDTTAEIRWTPSAGDVGDVTFGVLVADDGFLPLGDSEDFVVTVNPAPAAPVIETIDNTSVDAETEMVVTVTATDDNPGDTLTFELGAGSPAGATITKTGDTTAEVRWTPAVEDIDSSFNFEVIVTDDSASLLDDSETFSVLVTEANVAPVITAIDDQLVTFGTMLEIDITATDANTGQTLSFDFVSLPELPGATITKTGDTTATLSWTPDASDSALSRTVTILVEDNGNTPLSAVEEFTITFDTAAPSVASAPSGVLMSTFDSFDVVFDEEIPLDSLIVGNFQLRQIGVGMVPITSLDTADGVTVTLGVDADLAPGTYELTVDPSIVDLVGNPIEGTLEFGFTIVVEQVN